MLPVRGHGRSDRGRIPRARVRDRPLPQLRANWRTSHPRCDVPRDTEEYGHPPRCPPEENEEDHVSRNGRGLVQASLRRFRTDLCSAADHSRKRAGGGALEEARLFQARGRHLVIRTALCRHRGGCQYRRRAARRERGQRPSSGFADENHDALSAVRAARGRTADAREQIDRIRTRHRTGADQARPQSRDKRSRSKTRSRRWSPSRPTTPRSWSPKRSAAAKKNSPRR